MDGMSLIFSSGYETGVKLIVVIIIIMDFNALVTNVLWQIVQNGRNTDQELDCMAAMTVLVSGIAQGTFKPVAVQKIS
jgi:hypothetical protein